MSLEPTDSLRQLIKDYNPQILESDLTCNARYTIHGIILDKKYSDVFPQEYTCCRHIFLIDSITLCVVNVSYISLTPM